jgi:hypothetical protein
MSMDDRVYSIQIPSNKQTNRQKSKQRKPFFSRNQEKTASKKEERNKINFFRACDLTSWVYGMLYVMSKKAMNGNSFYNIFHYDHLDKCLNKSLNVQ